MTYYRFVGIKTAAPVAAGIPGFDLAWEWNQTDVSQFDGSATVATGGGAATLTANALADTDLPYDKSLDLAMTGTGTGHVTWLATDALVFSGEDRTMLFEWVAAEMTASRYGGFAFLGDDVGSYYGYANYIGSTGWDSRVDADTPVIGGGTTGWIWDGTKGSYGQMAINGRKPAGTDPEFTLTGWCHDQRTTLNTTKKYMSTWDGTPTAGWNSLACDRFGVSIQASGGNPFGTFKLLELRVYVAAA